MLAAGRVFVVDGDDPVRIFALRGQVTGHAHDFSQVAGDSRWQRCATPENMSPKPVENPSIQRALAAIEQLLTEVEASTGAVPHFRHTDLVPLSIDEQAHKARLEKNAYAAEPERSAAQFCLLSASALLGVTQLLLNRSATPSPSERLQDWNDLSELTKEAGRSAYRAALILADPERLVPPGF
ncbi:hypothetical protein LJR130_000105 [Variovorax sp. LjRoot130]|uniref:hypothetical protein n=1 Tax=unclassified Variovorax TaxID=663243 RepID=UPI003ED13EB9